MVDSDLLTSSVWDFLQTSAGIELTHAFIVLILATAGWITYRTHERLKSLGHDLNNHLDEHNAKRPPTYERPPSGTPTNYG
jgi:hypothetical protein